MPNSGYLAALAAMRRVTQIEFHLDCGMCGDSEMIDAQIDLHKVDAYHTARRNGWIYDCSGAWTCPDCLAKFKVRRRAPVVWTCPDCLAEFVDEHQSRCGDTPTPTSHTTKKRDA
jgi:ribosomal protein L37AE/L43A